MPPANAPPLASFPVAGSKASGNMSGSAGLDLRKATCGPVPRIS
jgi:hypothetical protein